MNPNAQAADGYKNNYRLFSPQSTLWIINPLGYDINFNVADENNVQYQYTLPKGATSELPGGSVATLGLKALIDEMIQVGKKDILRIYDAEVRKEYEDRVIIRFKEAANREKVPTEGGVIDLSVKSNDTPDEDLDQAGPEEEEFPGLKQTEDKQALTDIAEASLGAKNAVIAEK